MARFHPLKVTDVQRETRDAVVVTLAPRDEDKALFDFTQGQYLTFRRDFDGEELRRSYSVYFGDTLQVRLTCKEINPRENAQHGEVRWDCRVTNQDGAVVAQYDVLTMVAKQWPAATQAAE